VRQSLDAGDELEDIELGERASWWLLNYQLAGLYSDPAVAASHTALAIFGSVCEAVRGMTGRQDVTGLVPREWLPWPLREEEKHG